MKQMMKITWRYLACLLVYLVSGCEGQFSYEFLDTENTVLKLRCEGDCSMDITVVTIFIYNATSLSPMGVVNAGKVPCVFTPPLQDVSFFAGGGLFDDGGTKSCHLELVITNCNLLTRLHFGCNVSHSDIKASITTTSTSLTVDRKGFKEKDLLQYPLIYALITICLLAVALVIAVCLLCSGYRNSQRRLSQKQHTYTEIATDQGRELEVVAGSPSMPDNVDSLQHDYIEPISEDSSRCPSLNMGYSNVL